MKRLGLILFILLLVYFIFLIRHDFVDHLELKAEEKRVVNNIEKGEKLFSELKEKFKKLETNAYIEKLARTRLGLVKNGETAYKIIIE